MTDTDIEIFKPRGRPFERGVSGNPAGRPRGARNNSTLLAQALVADATDELVQKFIAEARNGNMPALLLAMKRILPSCRPPPLEFRLPPLDSPADAVRAIKCILAGLAAGELTESELKTLVGLVETYLKAHHETETDRRLTAIEVNIAALQSDAERKKSMSMRGQL